MTTTGYWPTMEPFTDSDSWYDLAACREISSDVFFPDSREGEVVALAYCKTCPVTGACLEQGLKERYGIWGGTTEKQRKALRRRRRF